MCIWCQTHDINVFMYVPYPQRIVYRVAALVRRCIECLAPPYLREHCCPTVTIQRRISLRTFFCAGRVTCPSHTDYDPTAPRLLCGWPGGLEWSCGCAVSDASGPLCSIPLWP